MNVRSLIDEGVALFNNEKFDEAIEKLNQALDGIEDKNSQIQEQNDIQFWLGRCYLEQALKAKGKESEQLFEQAVEHHQQQLSLAAQLADKQNSIQRQTYAQSWLGYCYFEQAKQAEGKESEQLFGQAVEHFQQQLRLAEQLADKQNSLQEQNNAQYWLGRYYLEQAMKAKGKKSEQLFRQAVEYFQQSLAFAKQQEDKKNSLQEQNDTQYWLGRCYLEQAMKAKGKESEQLFEHAVEHFQQQLRLAEQLEDKQNSIQEQNDTQYWLGRCYLEQAMKAKGKESEQLFEHAVEHFQQQLRLAEQLEDKQNSIQEQINAQAWSGRCYFEQAIKAKGKESEQLFEQAVKHRQQQLRLAEQLEDKQNSIQEQINAQFRLGRCYFEQAKKAKGKESEQLFGQAVEYFQQQLSLAEQLADKQNSLQQQINAEGWLGRCYFEQAMKSKGKESEQLFKQAVEHFQRLLEFVKQLEDKQNSLYVKINAQYWFGRCDFAQAISIKNSKDNAKILLKRAAGHFLYVLEQLEQLDDELEKKKLQRKIYRYLKEIYFLRAIWTLYFKWKKQEIQENLFENREGNLTDAISTILAVLNIPPFELGEIPLAHYTSPSVCERLFGIVSDQTNDKADDKDPIDSNKVSPMRIGSSTYMNDPTEGEGLLELLNLQDLELENKADCPAYNAFFTCFSSRVNDLNQFRLYGKENSVEASGCCLVFNKSGDWLKEPDISASFRSFTNKQNKGFKESIEADVAGSEDENLPLYQVAYIAYHDEYIAEEKCGKWLLNKNKLKFGIRLKPVGKNPSWHQLRIDKLEKALMELMEKSNNISDEDKKALEYIRYLFKDFAFRDEEEFRLLKIEQIGSDKIEYCPTTKSVYLPYADIRDIVDEVILGTNYEKSGKERKAEVFQHLMRKHYPNVKVSRSSLPINANPPIKKD